MFRGHHEKKIDSKGRVSVPAKFRDYLLEEFDGKLMITNMKSSLVAYPMAEWLKLEEKIMGTLPEFNPDAKSFQNVFLAGAEECTLDKQGRILIPPVLRKNAGIEKEVVFVGFLKNFQIWNKDLWDKEFQKDKSNFNEIAANLEKFGLK